jgi:hypothetical protein
MTQKPMRLKKHKKSLSETNLVALEDTKQKQRGYKIFNYKPPEDFLRLLDSNKDGRFEALSPRPSNANAQHSGIIGSRNHNNASATNRTEQDDHCQSNNPF